MSFLGIKTHKTIVKYGGRGGIRTPGSLATTSDFESDALDHSATLPTVDFTMLLCVSAKAILTFAA